MQYLFRPQVKKHPVNSAHPGLRAATQPRVIAKPQWLCMAHYWLSVMKHNYKDTVRWNKGDMIARRLTAWKGSCVAVDMLVGVVTDTM